MFRFRYWLFEKIFSFAINRILPNSRYKTELKQALWVLSLRVQAVNIANKAAVIGATALEGDEDVSPY